MKQFTLTELRALSELLNTGTDEFIDWPATPANCKLFEDTRTHYAKSHGQTNWGLNYFKSSTGTTVDVRHYELEEYMAVRVQTEIKKLEARASEWVALLEQQLQRLGDSSSTKVIGEVQGAKEDEDIAEEVVTRLEALYCGTWLIEAAYGYGYWDRLLNYNPPWVFKFTRKSTTSA
jgi:hypothetical protein